MSLSLYIRRNRAGQESTFSTLTGSLFCVYSPRSLPPGLRIGQHLSSRDDTLSAVLLTSEGPETGWR